MTIRSTVTRLLARAARFGPPAGDTAPAPDAAVMARVSALEEQLRREQLARERLELLLSSMHDAVFVIDTAGVVEQVNAAAAALLETTVEDLAGQAFDGLLANDGGNGFHLDGARMQRRELALRTRHGREVPVSCSCAALPDGWIITAHDIAERKLAEQRIRYLARIDSLTKVPNRMQFQHLVQRAIARARRGRHRLALLYLDLDHFKEVNDSHGHSAGDLCLEVLTERLSAKLPDGAIIGRLAGDEFGVLLDQLDLAQDLPAQVSAVVEPALTALHQPVDFQGHQLHLAASAGVAFYPRDAGNVIDLIRNADAALFHAKRRGGNRIEFYHPDMNAEAAERLLLKARLRQAFGKHELRVYYQPKYSLADGRLVGAEALVRWALDDRGLVLPADFIPLAEESSLILDIGEYVLDQVCTDLAGWQGFPSVDGSVAVNLSLRQLNQADFVGQVESILARRSIDPARLEMEITESTMMENPQRTIRILGELHDMGMRLAIDDFGTGYSSLSALQKFPISTLKIDQSFVGSVTSSHDQATICSMIIEMGHSLEMDVVAEGVETEDQLRFLRALNCDYAQGHLFGPAMPAERMGELIRAGNQSRYPTSSM